MFRYVPFETIPNFAYTLPTVGVPSGAANYTLSCDSASYTIGGDDVVFTTLTNYTLACDSAAYVIGGPSAQLIWSDAPVGGGGGQGMPAALFIHGIV